jgi:hypothetical protein
VAKSRTGFLEIWRPIGIDLDLYELAAQSEKLFLPILESDPDPLPLDFYSMVVDRQFLNLQHIAEGPGNAIAGTMLRVAGAVKVDGSAWKGDLRFNDLAFVFALQFSLDVFGRLLSHRRNRQEETENEG